MIVARPDVPNPFANESHMRVGSVTEAAQLEALDGSVRAEHGQTQPSGALQADQAAVGRIDIKKGVILHLKRRSDAEASQRKP